MAVDLSLAMIAATVKIEQAQADSSLTILGTGFLVNAPRADGTPRTVLVTAGHVFDNMKGPVVFLDYRLAEPGGGFRYSPQPLTIRSGATLEWTRSPDEDVAVMAIQAPPEFAKAAIPLAWLADDSSFQPTGGIEPGDEMFALGFPEGLSANPEGFPILRAAHVASWPLITTPTYPRFMLDMRVFDGASGGPVFLASTLQRRPGDALAGQPYVTGLVAAASPQYQWAFVIEAPVIRRAIGLLDTSPPPAASAPASPFAILPPTSSRSAADAGR